MNGVIGTKSPVDAGGRGGLEWRLPFLCGAATWTAALIVVGPVRNELVDFGSPVHVGEFALQLSEVVAPGRIASAYLLRDHAARLMWAALELLLVAGFMIGTAAALWIIGASWRRMPMRTRRVWGGTMLMLSLVVIKTLLPVLRGDSHGLTFQFDHVLKDMAAVETCVRSGEDVVPCISAYKFRPDSFPFDEYSAWPLVQQLSDVSNALSVVFVLIVMGAMAATMARDLVASRVVPELQQVERDLKDLLYLGALMLVVGVAEIYALHHWPTVHFGEETASLAEDVARAIATVFGAFFTFLLASIFVPASIAVGRMARIEGIRTLEEAGQGSAVITGTELRNWLDQNGFGDDLRSRLAQFVAIVAPLVTGFFGGSLIDLSVLFGA